MAPAGSTIARVRAYGIVADDGRLELLRLTLADGSEGMAGFGGCGERAPHCLVDEAATLADGVLDADAACRGALVDRLAGEASAVDASLCDIALWDAWCRHLGVPLWQVLGGFRERLPACAVLPRPESLEAALDAVRRVAAMGYRGIKLRLGADAAFDLELVATLAAAFPESEPRFMVALGGDCGFEDARRLGDCLAEQGFDWMEAPFPDADLAAYAELNRAVAVDVLTAGDAPGGLSYWRQGLESGAWSRLRADACLGGGITGVLRAMALAGAAGVPVELCSTGHPPAQAANLHLMLGVPGCTWFEHHDPLRPRDYGVLAPLALDAEGRIAAPEAPGLGLAMDWTRIAAEADTVFDSAA